MKLNDLQTIVVIVLLIIFCIWSLANIADQLFLGNRGVEIPDQFWALLATAVGALLYALKYTTKNGSSKK